MKVELPPETHAVRGAAVVVGNVYANNRPPAFYNFRVVVGIVDQASGGRPWNCVVLIHVDAFGNVVGCSRQPRQYIKDHWDLVGHVKDMPTLKIEWIKKPRGK